jgi:hypothetical protein
MNREETYSIEEKSICHETGQDKIICEHCQNNKVSLQQLKNTIANNNGNIQRK